jgi:hypothetical protein
MAQRPANRPNNPEKLDAVICCVVREKVKSAMSSRSDRIGYVIAEVSINADF